MSSIWSTIALVLCVGFLEQTLPMASTQRWQFTLELTGHDHQPSTALVPAAWCARSLRVDGLQYIEDVQALVHRRKLEAHMTAEQSSFQRAVHPPKANLSEARVQKPLGVMQVFMFYVLVYTMFTEIVVVICLRFDPLINFSHDDSKQFFDIEWEA